MNRLVAFWLVGLVVAACGAQATPTPARSPADYVLSSPGYTFEALPDTDAKTLTDRIAGSVGKAGISDYVAKAITVQGTRVGLVIVAEMSPPVADPTGFWNGLVSGAQEAGVTMQHATVIGRDVVYGRFKDGTTGWFWLDQNLLLVVYSSELTLVSGLIAAQPKR